MASAATRRQLLAGSIGAAAGLAGISVSAAQGDTGTTGTPTGRAIPIPVQDGNVSQTLLAAERVLEYGAEKSLGSGKLHQDARELVLLILAHGEEHVAALQAELRRLHLPPADIKKPPSTPPDVVNLFKDIKNETQALQAMVQLESLMESAYFTAAGTFYARRLAQLAAEILACHAQQWALLELLLHKGSPTVGVPHPAVRGSKHIGKPHKTS